MVETDTAHPAVCDAGPRIHLDELGCPDLLEGFDPIVIPDAVHTEVTRHRPRAFSRPRGSLARSAPPAPDPALQTLFDSLALSRGERQALLLARGLPGSVFLTDDTAARAVAQVLELPVHGTIGLIVRALRRGTRTADQALQILESIPTQSTLHVRPSLLEGIIAEIRGRGSMPS